MAEPHTVSAMARETAEIPAAAERLLARSDVFAPIVERIEQAKPRIIVFCGRGSSGHIGVYLRYLFEARLGLLGSAAAPSVGYAALAVDQQSQAQAITIPHTDAGRPF